MYLVMKNFLLTIIRKSYTQGTIERNYIRNIKTYKV